MKRPIARPTATITEDSEALRVPRAFAPAKVEIAEIDFDPAMGETLAAPPPRPMGWLGRLAWTTGGVLLSAGLGLAADRLIRDLFERNEWLGRHRRAGAVCAGRIGAGGAGNVCAAAAEGAR